MAWVFGDETQLGGGECHRVKVYIHLYSLAVQAGFYGDAVECLTATRDTRVRSPSGSGPKIYFFTCHICLLPSSPKIITSAPQVPEYKKPYSPSTPKILGASYMLRYLRKCRVVVETFRCRFSRVVRKPAFCICERRRSASRLPRS